MAQFLSDPVTGLQGLAALVNSAELRAQLGEAVVESLNKKIGEIETALRVGGNEQALRFGENIGELTWQVGSAVTAVGGTAKAGAELGKLGIKASGKVLDQMAERGAALNKAHWVRDAAKTESLAVKEGVKGVGGTIDRTTVGIEWGKGIQGQGMPWENYLETQLPAQSRLPQNFKTFDFFDEKTRVATSAKTLDTTTVAKMSNPHQIYSSLKRNIDEVAEFTKHSLKKITVDSSQITNRELQVAIPKSTTNTQWIEINKAIEYGQSRGVTVKITKVD